MAHIEPSTESAARPGRRLVDSRNQPVVQLTWRDRDGRHRLVVDQLTVVGSSSQTTLRIADPGISRLHASFAPDVDGLIVQDMGSKNGMFAGDTRITSALIAPGSTLRLGTTLIRVDRVADPVAVPISTEPSFGPMRGRSEAMRELFHKMSGAARTTAPVLLEGETGTGKSLAARAIHEASARAGQAFEIFDVGATPEHRCGEELFGREGAPGAIDAAEGGTLLIEDIDEMPLAVQARLAMVLDSATSLRARSGHHRAVDVRFILTTRESPLAARVNRGVFREELYFRIAALPLQMPPLGSRPEDLPDLAAEILAQLGAPPLASEQLGMLMKRSWPGNVHELRNALTGLAAGVTPFPPSSGGASSPRGMPHDVSIDRTFHEERDRALLVFQHEYLLAMIARHGRNIAKLAAAAGLAESYVRQLLRAHGM